jgi:glyoxylase-like metal-dependent hydrolase (beta-lactamase superfamily II)
MKLIPIQSGLFKLDGGAMFGVVPKTMWNKMNPADENNLCTWALRCLLIDTGSRVILVDTGLGYKQDEKFRSHFQPHGPFDLKNSLQQAGYTPENITDVFITHMHFDHVGGAVDKNGEIAFPNARYWTNKKHLAWALHPNEREKASFLKENIVPLQDANCLEFLECSSKLEWIEWFDGISYLTLYGHTEAMMVLKIPYKNTFIYYGADLIPSSYHIGMPYIMSYDLRPLETLKEKDFFLKDVLDEQGFIFFEHDPSAEIASVTTLPNGRIALNTLMTLTNI